MFRKTFGRVLTLALCVCLFLCAFVPTASGASPAPSAPSPVQIQFTEEERAYIQSCGTLRVGYVQDRIPVSFTGKDGELDGISRYIFDRLAQLSGLTLEYVPLPAGSITYDYLMEQKLDLVTSVEYNKENLNARGILISEPYLSSRKVVVARRNLAFDPNANLSVAVSTGSQTLKKVLNGIYPNFRLEDYDSSPTASTPCWPIRRT